MISTKVCVTLGLRSRLQGQVQVQLRSSGLQGPWLRVTVYSRVTLRDIAVPGPGDMVGPLRSRSGVGVCERVDGAESTEGVALLLQSGLGLA